MLVYCWPNSKPTLAQRLMLAGNSFKAWLDYGSSMPVITLYISFEIPLGYYKVVI